MLSLNIISFNSRHLNKLDYSANGTLIKKVRIIKHIFEYFQFTIINGTRIIINIRTTKYQASWDHEVFELFRGNIYI